MIAYSIIIPVYNMEDTIYGCLQSILVQQHYKEYEIVIINDGSTDNTLLEINRIKQEYPRHHIKIIDGEHQGVSSARNLGIQCASGEYLLFVDADDYLTTSSLLNIENGIVDSQNADWLIFESNISMDFDNKQYELNFKKKEMIASILCRTQLSYYKNIDIYQFSPGPVSKLYRKEIIVDHNLQFDPKLRMGEDIIFNLEYLQVSQQVYFKKVDLYHYNESTSSKLFSTSNLENELIFHKKIKSLLKFYHPDILQKMEITGAIFLIKKYYLIYPSWTYQQKIKKLTDFFKTHSYYLSSMKYFYKYKHQLGRYNCMICYFMRHKLYFLLYLLIKYRK